MSLLPPPPKNDKISSAFSYNFKSALTLTQRFDKAKARLEEVTEQISQKQTQRANYEAFLKAFEKLPDQLPEFTLETWHGLVDYVTVYAEDDIRFTFKNGQEVKA